MTRFCPECSTHQAEPECPIHGCPTLVRQQPVIAATLLGTVVGGRYRIQREIGHGGFGTVFQAQHTSTRQALVVKVLKPEFAKDPVQVQRFFNEGKTASQLTHPHTVRVFDFGQTDRGELYLAMELLDGRELAAVLLEDGSLEPLRAVRIAISVCKSLADAHQHGLVHRDLKPDNIFLCRIHGDDDFVKLIDFGIAKSFESADQHLTQDGVIVGSPRYMSPEQARAEPLDGRSDLYSLGVILYHCLTGVLPFQAPSAMALLVKHMQEAPRPPSELCSRPLPVGLEAIVMRALAKARDQRFADADDMRAALENVLAQAHLAAIAIDKAAPSAVPIASTSEPATMAHNAPKPALPLAAPGPPPPTARNRSPAQFAAELVQAGATVTEAVNAAARRPPHVSAPHVPYVTAPHVAQREGGNHPTQGKRGGAAMPLVLVGMMVLGAAAVGGYFQLNSNISLSDRIERLGARAGRFSDKVGDVAGKAALKAGDLATEAMPATPVPDDAKGKR